MNSCTFVILSALALSPTLGVAEDGWDMPGPYGGWINDLQKDSSGRILAATSFGGIYRSSDDAESWQQIYDGTLIIDPRSVATNASGHIFVGTDGFEGTGFLRSTDDGATWQVINNALSSKIVNDLLVAPNQSIFACTFQGLYRSTDGGTTFTQLPGLPSFTSRVEANSNGDLFLGVLSTSTNLFRSTDNGASWQQRDSGIVFDVTDIHAAGSTLYATAGNVIHRSTDNGTTWTSLNAPPEFSYTSVTVAANGDICASFYGGSEAGGRIYRTTDGGGSWTQDPGLSGHAVDRLLSTPEGPLFVGAKGSGVFRHSGDEATEWEARVTGMCNTWIGAIAHDPVSGWTYAATRNNGVFRSSDEGSSWTPSSNGIPIDENPTGLVFDLDGVAYCSGYRGIYKSTDYGESWMLILEDTTTSAVHCTAQGDVFGGNGSRMYRSTDGGSNWTFTDLPGAENIAGIASDGIVVYAACGTPGGFGSAGVYRSTDNGNTFAAFNDGLTDLDVTCVAVGDPGNPDCRITAGTGSGIFHLDETSGTWELDQGYGPASVVHIDKHSDSDERRGLVAERTRARQLFRNPRVQTEPGCSQGVKLDPRMPVDENWFIYGFFALGSVTSRRGAPDVIDMIGTVGHGIYRHRPDTPADVTPPEPDPGPFLFRNDPNPFDRRTVIEYEVASREIVTLEVFDASGRQVATLVEGWKDPGRHTAAWDADAWPSGVYYARLSTPGSEQSRRLVLLR